MGLKHTYNDRKERHPTKKAAPTCKYIYNNKREILR